jgi:hypothetical protein
MGAFEFGNLNINQDTDKDGMPDWWEYRFGLDPNDSNDAQKDLDGDGLTNLAEYENNCDAAFFDTDGDLLPDGWEVMYGLNPRISDVIAVVNGNNVYADSDGDGLDALREVVYGTNPTAADSDGDGASDGIEVAQGSLPNDATDWGLPPSADQVCTLRLTVGDWSSSNSERYDLVVGPITHQATQFGVVATANYSQFRPGNRYEVRIVHRGTDPAKWFYPNADYDYVAQIEAVSLPAGVVMQIEDADRILGYHGEPNTPNHIFDAAGKVAYVNLIKVEVTGIEFDHSSGDSADGISIGDTGVPEWIENVQNDPAAYKKNINVTIKARFEVSPALITSAKIRATTSGSILGNLGEQTVNFFSGVSSPEYVTFTPSSSTPGSISKGTVTWQWKAKDLNGESSSEYNINVSGPHTIYTVYDSPKCSLDECTADHFKWSCTKAQGEDTERGTADAIHTALDADPPLDGNEGSINTDGWELLLGSPYSGWCDEQARFMVRVLKLLGTTGTAYNTYASSDTAVTTYESKEQNGKTWFLKFDFDNNGEIDNNFEGSVSSGSHYYAVWPSLDADSECGLLRKVGPDGIGATQRWVRTDDGTFGGRTEETLPGTEAYPVCP